MKYIILCFIYFWAGSASGANFRNSFSNYMMISPAQLVQARSGQFEIFSTVGSGGIVKPESTDSTATSDTSEDADISKGKSLIVHAVLPSVLNIGLGFDYIKDSMGTENSLGEKSIKDQTMTGKAAVAMGGRFRIGVSAEQKRRDFENYYEETLTPSGGMLINLKSMEFGVAVNYAAEKSTYAIDNQTLPLEVTEKPKRIRFHTRVLFLTAFAVGGYYGTTSGEANPEEYGGAGLTVMVASRFRTDLGYKYAQPRTFNESTSIKRESTRASLAYMLDGNLNILWTYERHKAGGANFSSKDQYAADHAATYFGGGLVIRL